MSNAFLSVEIAVCRAQRHRLKAAWSDKTPLKVSLICVTCSERYGKNAYAAYGVEQGSFGQWLKRHRDFEESKESNIEKET